MNELSIFIDESGDFGEYAHHSPYYIIAMVFHDQRIDISDEVKKLDDSLRGIRMPNHCIHTGPIIRKEGFYEDLGIAERRRLFNKLVAFCRQVDIHYKVIHIEKKYVSDVVEASAQLSRLISAFIRNNYPLFQTYDRIKIYYDNGQIEVSRLLSSVFSALLQEVEFKRVMPAEYKLFQVADLLCSLELVKLKLNSGGMSLSEKKFFGNTRSLKKNYLIPIEKKEWK